MPPRGRTATASAAGTSTSTTAPRCACPIRETFLLPLDTDLTRETAYTARFEYRVDYYAKSFNDPDLFPEELVVSKWERYESVPAQIEGPIFDAESVLHWGADYARHDRRDEPCDGIYAQKIVAPVKLYSHNVVEKETSESWWTPIFRAPAM